jgi:hypothetical protein
MEKDTNFVHLDGRSLFQHLSPIYFFDFPLHRTKPHLISKSVSLGELQDAFSTRSKVETVLQKEFFDHKLRVDTLEHYVLSLAAAIRTENSILSALKFRWSPPLCDDCQLFVAGGIEFELSQAMICLAMARCNAAYRTAASGGAIYFSVLSNIFIQSSFLCA